MDASRRRPRRRPGENRERLIASGVVEFAGLGYRGASTARIAALAGVPQPHVYANFTAKRDLFLVCVNRAAETLLESLPGPASAEGESVVVGVEHELRLMLQAFASIDDPEFDGRLRPLLVEVREKVGDQRLGALIARAAELALTAGE